MTTVLVLDDDREVVDLLSAILHDAGHRPVAATGLDEVARDLQPDLVITDLVPLSSYSADAAREWVSALRGRYRAPVIVLTGHSAAADEPDRLGADELIEKPFDVDALVARVAALLPGRGVTS